MSTAQVSIFATLFGTNEVTAGLRRMAEAVSSIGMSAVAVGRLGEQMGFLNEQTADVLVTMGSMVSLTSAVVRGFAALQSASLSVAIAEKARAAAHVVANALSGPAGWAVIAASAAAVTAGLALIAQSNVPTRHKGGAIRENGLYNLLSGEYVLNREETAALQNNNALNPNVDSIREYFTQNQIINDIKITVQGARDYGEAYRGAYDGTTDALRRAGTL